MMKIPYMLVIGDKEAENGQVAVRTRAGADLGAMEVGDLIAKLEREIRERTL